MTYHSLKKQEANEYSYQIRVLTVVIRIRFVTLHVRRYTIQIKIFILSTTYYSTSSHVIAHATHQISFHRLTMLRSIIWAVQVYYFCNIPIISAVNVLVYSDAVYALEDDLSGCTGYGALPVSTSCPRKGDVAIGGCHSGLSSWNRSHQACLAPEDAKCVVLDGNWICRFLSDRKSMRYPFSRACDQMWSFEGKDYISDAMWKTSASQNTKYETPKWFTRESRPASLGVCGKDTTSYTAGSVHYKGTLRNQNGSEERLSDGSGMELSDGSKLDLLDGSKVALSDGSEVELSDGSEVDLSDAIELLVSGKSGVLSSGGNEMESSDGNELRSSDESNKSDSPEMLPDPGWSEMEASEMLPEESAGSGWMDSEESIPSSRLIDTERANAASTSNIDDSLYLLDVWSDSGDTSFVTEESEVTFDTLLNEDPANIPSGSESNDSTQFFAESFWTESSRNDLRGSDSDTSDPGISKDSSQSETSNKERSELLAESGSGSWSSDFLA